jgi:hypothetical protein
MFDSIKKKIQKNNPPKKNKGNGSEEDSIEAPDVDGTLNDLDAALAKADQIKAQKKRDEESERQKLRDRERGGGGSRCGCGGSW